jgi:proliferating cell nuclear antigen
MEIYIQNPQRADAFVALFQNIKQFTEPINIFFEEGRMFIQTMDSAHVSILEIALPARWFDEYASRPEGGASEDATWQNIVIGLNVSVFSKILATREKSQTIRILYNLEDSDKLFIHFVSENKAIYDKHFEIPLLDIDANVMNIPDIEYEAEFSITAPNFANIINQLKMFGDTMDIHCSEDKIILYSNSAESGKMFVEISMDDLTEFSIEEGGKLELSFSLTYLHKICMYHKLVKDMEIKLSANTPMKIVFSLEDKPASEDGAEMPPIAQMSFYLAPKMGDD